MLIEPSIESADWHELELVIMFGGGEGITRAIGLDAVWFATRVELAIGHHLSGTIHFTAEQRSLALDGLRFEARVTCIWMPAEREQPFEVSAQFERLDFVFTPEPCASKGCEG